MKLKNRLISLFAVLAMACTSLASASVHAAERVVDAVGAVALKAHDALFDYMGRMGFVAFAVVTIKSTAIGNRDAVPAVINDGRLERGSLRASVGSVAVGAADSATSYYPLCSVPSTAMVRSVLASAIAGMTTLAGNVGVFLNTKASGGVALGTPAFTGSGTFFASAQSFATVLSRSDITNQSTTNTPAKREQPLWQAIGMAADPGGTLDIGVTVTTANTGAAGQLGLEVHYVDNGS